MFRFRDIETRSWEQFAAKQRHALLTRECECGCGRGKRFGAKPLGTEHRKHRSPQPSSTADEIAVTKNVVHVMAWISLVARQIENLIDGMQKRAVDLDRAAIPTMVDAITAPWTIGDVLDVHSLFGRQLEMTRGLGATGCEGARDDAVETPARNDKAALVCIQPTGERLRSRQQAVQARVQRVSRVSCARQTLVDWQELSQLVRECRCSPGKSISAERHRIKLCFEDG